MATVAGSGLRGPPDAPLAQAQINGIYALTEDQRGNLIFSEFPSSGLRFVNLGDSKHLGVEAGTVGRLLGGRYGCRAGDANSAEMMVPTGLVTDASGHVYVSDFGCSVIWKITPDHRSVTIFAGSPGTYGHADGQGQAARFRRPRGLAKALDGTLYVSDWDSHVVRRVARDGSVTTVAGSPDQPGTNDGKALTEARLARPAGIAVSSDHDVFVAEWEHAAIRRIQTQGGGEGLVSSPLPVSGPGTCNTIWNARYGYPGHTTLALLGSDLIVPFWNNGVWRLSPGEPGKDWNAVQALSESGAIAVHVTGDRIWVGGWTFGEGISNTVRVYRGAKLDQPAERIIGTPGLPGVQDGPAAEAAFDFAWCGGGVTVDDDGNAWVAERCANRVRRISPAGVVTSFGTGRYGELGGTPAEAQFCEPTAISARGSEVFVIDRGCNQSVMHIDTTTGTVTKRASTCVEGEPSCPLASESTGVAIDGEGSLFFMTNYESLAGTSAKYGTSCWNGMPMLVKVPDHGNGKAVFFAGTPNNPADPDDRNKCVDGAPGTGQFAGAGAASVAIDEQGALLVADGPCGIRAVDQNGAITTLLGGINATGLTFGRGGDKRLVVVIDDSLYALEPAGGERTLLAGAPFKWDDHFRDGSANEARFWVPRALASDALGNIYAVDNGNNRVRVIFR